MPYYISDTAEGCDGWATVKEDGEVMGCHMSKQDAIDQGLAIAQAEGSTFEGERNLEELLEDAPGGGLPDNYRPATSNDVPEGRACGNCIFFNEERLNDEGEAYCEWWEAFVRGGNYCNAWQGKESRPYHDDEDEERQPAPPEEQIEGSDKNKPGSAAGPGGDIELSKTVQTALRNKVKEHNDQMKEENKPDYSRTTYGQLAAVYRRGAGAFSVSHRPGMTRGGWAMARVNAYLYLLANGKPKRPAYVQDNDLLPKDHPKSTRSIEGEQRDVNLTPPAYMRASARRGLEWHREGLSGDGLVDRTLREARAMAEGNMTADKWVRTAAWIARHLVDMDAPQNTPGDDNYPGPGAVAMALWGGGGSKRSAQRALDYAEGVVDTIRRENEGRNVTGEAQAKLERRHFDTADFEIREEGDGFRIEGYAALFNSRSENLGGFTETIQRGAFRQSLQSRNNVMFYYNHNSSQVLASTRAGTLRLEEDERGLKVSASVAPTSYGRDAKILVERGDVTGFSFGFSMPSSGGDEWNAAGTERILKSVRLFEVSLVGSPAYTETNGTAMVRGLDKIAERAEVDADALADALLKIENGEDITTDDRQLVDKVLAELSPVPEPADDTYSKDMLALKKKKLQLLMGTP